MFKFKFVLKTFLIILLLLFFLECMNKINWLKKHIYIYIFIEVKVGYYLVYSLIRYNKYYNIFELIK